VTVSCGVEPASADVELVNVQAVVPFGVPIPKPIATPGDIVASVTLTVPDWVVVNVDRLVPCTPTAPLNVSVDVVGVGVWVVDDGEVRSFRRLHPPPVTAATIASAMATDCREKRSRAAASGMC
jgi:hypothetical protein